MDSDPQLVDRVTVVGGGDVGLLTALALEKNLDGSEVVVIDDFEEDVPEVGKSTLTAVVRVLHKSLEIDRMRLLENVKLAWKTSVYLEDWCGKTFHSPLGVTIPVVNSLEEQSLHDSMASRNRNLTRDYQAEFHEFYYRYEQGDFSTMYGELAEHPGKTPFVISPSNPSTVEFGLFDVAYQFDSTSLNRFLRTICEERGIRLIDDRITEVQTGDDRIERIASDSTEYTADLYVDATGFRRLLMEELDNDFVDFNLPVDSAVVATTDVSLDDVTSATVVTTGDAGWFWQIDTVDIRDLGYVYSSSHISDEAAKREFIETRDEDIDMDDIRQYRFESGVLETPWVNNCVAAGNALGFVEPLQSTALTTSAVLAERLARLLGAHGKINHDDLRELYNTSTRATWEDVYKFISIYYLFNDGSTQFWEDARSIDIDPEDIPQYETYQTTGFASPDDWIRLTQPQTNVNGWYLYHLILRELGVESRFFEELDFEVDPDVVDAIDEHTAGLSDRTDDFLSYKEYYNSFHPGYD